ncbi:unnamed protein product [Merluccius merluccius]
MSVPKVIEKPVLSENISAPDTENAVALVVPEPSHEQVPTGVDIEGDIHEPAEKEEESNAEVVEDDVAMQEEEGAATEAYVKTSTPDDANTQTPNITDPSLDGVATEAERQETMEPVRVLQPVVRQDMTEVAEEIKGEVDAEVESVEEVGVTDANENMDVGCKVENEGENVLRSLATEGEIMEESEQDVWLDAKEDIVKQEGPEKSEIEPQVCESQVESSQSDTEEAEFLDTTEHAPPEADGSPEERLTARATCELESEGEDFAIALEDPAVITLTEMRVMCKEMD